MLQNFLISAWRNTIKNKVFSMINIVGLATGLMSCILIMLFVRQEMNFDRWIPGFEKVVRMHTGYVAPGNPPFLTVRSAGMMMPAVRDYMPGEIESGTRLFSFGTTVRQNGQGIAEELSFADSSFFDVLDLPFAHGSVESSFITPMSLLLTEEMALKYFGRTDVIGETLTLCCLDANTTDFQITGILRDIPDNSHLQIDMLVYMDPQMFADYDWLLTTWTSLNVYTYFKLKPEVSLQQAQQRLSYWVDNESPFVEMAKENFGEMSGDMKVSEAIQHKLMYLADLHLNAYKDAGSMGDMRALGRKGMVLSFILVAVLVLTIACINFVNLATARASQRTKEVAMRKILGASRKQIAMQFLAESVLLVFISLLLALAATEILLPAFNQILGTQIQLRLANDLPLLFSLLTGGLVVGLVAGVYPALVLSNYRPAQILSSSKGNDSGASSKLRSALVIFQFAISIALLIGTVVIYTQTRYSNDMDLGYRSENKLVLNVDEVRDKLDSVKQQIETLPEVSSVVYSSEVPSQDRENNQTFTLLDAQPGQSSAAELLNIHFMDFGFFEAYQVAPIAGRLFDREFGSDQVMPVAEGKIAHGGAILNQRALRKLGIADPQQAIGKTIKSGELGGVIHEFTIVGVIPDLYFRSVKFSIRPTIYMLKPERFRAATIDYQTNDLAGLREKIEGIWKRVAPMQPMDLNYLSDMLAAQYQSEARQMQLFSAFSVLAILVACLGLYGLAAFTAQRRTKEIGIRKVMGANVRDIVLLLVWQFSRPVLIANLLAWPIGGWLMFNWLQAFPYRIDTYWLLPICAVAGLLSVIIAWLTVGGNAIRVARAKPIEALRHE
jgi:putative ABC transport system permease protein